MIIVKVNEPQKPQPGNVWFDPTTKLTRFYGHIVGWLTFTIPPGLRPSGGYTGDVWIDSVSKIPEMFDGINWIPAVPFGYKFPPTNPIMGDSWLEAFSSIVYIFDGIHWVDANSIFSIQNVSNGISPNSNSTGSQQTSPTPHLPVSGSAPFVPTTGAFYAPSSTAQIKIIGPNNDVLVSIDTLTGIITYGSNYTPDAAAQIFWRALSGTSPRFMQTQIDTLVEDLKTVSSRLAVAEGTVLRFTELGYKLPQPSKPFDPNDSWDRAMGIIK